MTRLCLWELAAVFCQNSLTKERESRKRTGFKPVSLGGVLSWTQRVGPVYAVIAGDDAPWRTVPSLHWI